MTRNQYAPRQRLAMPTRRLKGHQEETTAGVRMWSASRLGKSAAAGLVRLAGHPSARPLHLLCVSQVGSLSPRWLAFITPAACSPQMQKHILTFSSSRYVALCFYCIIAKLYPACCGHNKHCPVDIAWSMQSVEQRYSICKELSRPACLHLCIRL